MAVYKAHVTARDSTGQTPAPRGARWPAGKGPDFTLETTLGQMTLPKSGHPLKMPPDAGGITSGCPLLGGAICPNVVHDSNGQTPLHHAARDGPPGKVLALLEGRINSRKLTDLYREPRLST